MLFLAQASPSWWKQAGTAGWLTPKYPQEAPEHGRHSGGKLPFPGKTPQTGKFFSCFPRFVTLFLDAWKGGIGNVPSAARDQPPHHQDVKGF